MAVEGSRVGEPERAVASDHLDVRDPFPAQIEPRRLGELGYALDGEDAAGELCEQRRLVAEPGADLEDGVVFSQVQGLDHESDERRL